MSELIEVENSLIENLKTMLEEYSNDYGASVQHGNKAPPPFELTTLSQAISALEETNQLKQSLEIVAADRDAKVADIIALKEQTAPTPIDKIPDEWKDGRPVDLFFREKPKDDWPESEVKLWEWKDKRHVHARFELRNGHAGWLSEAGSWANEDFFTHAMLIPSIDTER